MDDLPSLDEIELVTLAFLVQKLEAGVTTVDPENLTRFLTHFKAGERLTAITSLFISLGVLELRQTPEPPKAKNALTRDNPETHAFLHHHQTKSHWWFITGKS